MESIVNAVWGCSRLKFVRAECFLDEILCGVNSNFLDFMYACYAKLQPGDLDVLCTVLWQAWYQRKGCVWDAWIQDPTPSVSDPSCPSSPAPPRRPPTTSVSSPPPATSWRFQWTKLEFRDQEL
ncbi:hypothetical protein LWI29_014555 [Acer saccharum]|uniref:Uncharacterized protein n=1 Tax=Acer saccharum TaxID=4024 RepID=A0AA39RR02_ACESA|nr:hypothetical protein LWI29_014555 [Acer saccharum]